MRQALQILVGVGLVVVAASCATIRPPSSTPDTSKKMVVTGYCKCRDCCGWDRNWLGRPVFTSGPNKGKYKQVGQTANGSMADHGTLAADTALYPFGTIMYIEGYGYGRVEDTGGRVKGQHIDLYFHSHRGANEWGKQMVVVEVWYPKK